MNYRGINNNQSEVQLGDEPALSSDPSEGHMPQSREVSVQWFSGAVLTGLASILLMGAALVIAFRGQDTFSLAYEQFARAYGELATNSVGRSDRVRPVAKTKSDRETIEASIQVRDGSLSRIRKQPFTRIRATMATSATSLSRDIPDYDPTRLLSRNQPKAGAEINVSTDIYGAEVEGEVSVQITDLNLNTTPARGAVNDVDAARYVMASLSTSIIDGDIVGVPIVPESNGLLRDLGPVEQGQQFGNTNLSVVYGKSGTGKGGTSSRAERVIGIKKRTQLADALVKNGFNERDVPNIARTLSDAIRNSELNENHRLRILLGSLPNEQTQIPFRLSIYEKKAHLATVALTDDRSYVLALAPEEIEFTEEDTEQINVKALPSIYRSFYETGRKQDLDDETIERLLSLYAFDLDLTNKVAPGDSIEILKSKPADGEQPEILYVSLIHKGQERKFYRFKDDDDVVDFFDPKGQTGKKFLLRRPIKGGGRLSSKYGMRIHPILRERRMHTGVDLAARTGTPIFAAGDGLVTRVQWRGGYGRYISLKHANGYETSYAHLHRYAKGMKPGLRVQQGQIIGYVGNTGRSTGPHLHYEIKINGRFQNPLSVRLPRAKSLSAQHMRAFNERVRQIDNLMSREAIGPVRTANASAAP